MARFLGLRSKVKLHIVVPIITSVFNIIIFAHKIVEKSTTTVDVLFTVTGSCMILIGVSELVYIAIGQTNLEWRDSMVLHTVHEMLS